MNDATVVYRHPPLSPEHRAKISGALKGRPKTRKHRAAISRAMRERQSARTD